MICNEYQGCYKNSYADDDYDVLCSINEFYGVIPIQFQINN